MSNRQDPETLLIRRQELEAARKRRPEPRSWPSSPRTTRAPMMHPPPPPPRMQPPPPQLALAREQAQPPAPSTLTVSRLKVTCVLNADEVCAVAAPEGKPRVILRIRLPERILTADVAAKSLRKAQATIRESGADNLVLILQGRLVAGDVIAEAGLSAQTKIKSDNPQ